ncbi:hypothetical protein IAU59_003535 [Kwoniella sp. CBS 9459]
MGSCLSSNSIDPQGRHPYLQPTMVPIGPTAMRIPRPQSVDFDARVRRMGGEYARYPGSGLGPRPGPGTVPPWIPPNEWQVRYS